MRRGTLSAGRAGFTLIELLVVIAILALLAALIAAGITKVKEGQQSAVTNQSLVKLQTALTNQWKVTCDKCRDDARTFHTPNKQADFVKMVTICDGDVPRAEALWMFMNLRRAMPETFAEARQDIYIENAAKTVSVTLPKSTAFKEIQNNAAAKGQPEEETAALLYIILGQGARGTNFSIDDAMQGAQTQLTFGNLSLPAFKDGFGTYIAFRRFYQSEDLFSGEYGRLRDKTVLQKGVDPIDDPLDTVGRLKLWNNPTVKAAAQTAVGATFNGRNRIATPISAGVDARDLPDGQKHGAFGNSVRLPIHNTLVEPDNDNAYGYRVQRSGNKGD